MLTLAEFREWLVSLYHRLHLCGHGPHTKLAGVWQHPKANLYALRKLGGVVEGKR
jgi:hypothetical protein